MLKTLSDNAQIILLDKIVELGRWDDLGVIVECGNRPAAQMAAYFWRDAVLANHGLAAKWAPRKGPIAAKLRNFWGMTPKPYRKTSVNATNVVEQKLCAKQWNDIEFGKVPSVAAARYNAAFFRNALEKYQAYKEALVKGEEKINASAIFPHDIVRAVYGGMRVDHDVINEQWKALPNYLGENPNDILVMADVSGSMHCPVSGIIRAIDVCISLGLYISERQIGAFKDLVLTFSSRPTFHKVHGGNINGRIINLARANWGMSTDLNAAFKEVLRVALKYKVPATDMPKILLVLSDMEFDYCCHTNFQEAQQMFDASGYEMPKIVFWNLNSRTQNVPVRYNQQGVALVSGFSPAILKSILSAQDFTPVQIMLDTIMNSRYDVKGLTVA